jgi:hypothetical protein
MQMNDDFPMIMEREAGAPENVTPVGVAFGLFPMLDKGATKKAGHEVYKEVEHVKIGIPGDRSTLIFQPSTETYRRRFPRAYDAYLKRGQQPVDGLPIEQWAAISRSLAMTMRAAHIPTVEALAAIHDGHVDKFGFNARELREKARAWLAQAKDSAATLALAQEKKVLEDRLTAMQAQIADLLAGKGVKKADAPAAAPVAAPPDTTADVEADVVAAARRPRARRAA